MNDLLRIPCVMMRGGTSRGPFFLASDLPSDPDARAAILIDAMGAGHAMQIDGIGGGTAVTSKVAIVGPSRRPGADVEYLFAQVMVRERRVDTSPNCGNMLAGVGPFAIEAGLVLPHADVTVVRVYNVNTGKLIEARVPTPGGRVTYDGEARIDGVPGTGAAILLSFMDAAGSKTGRLLPTGAATDMVDGIEVSAVDAAMPVVLIRASDLGKSGLETPQELDADPAFVARLEALRIGTGLRMGFPDPAALVIPKPVLIAPPTGGGMLTVRYFVPHGCHPSVATTGAVAIATACVTPGTVAHGMTGGSSVPALLGLEHPQGRLDVQLDHTEGQDAPTASIVRTARRLFEGAVLVRRETRIAA